MLRPGRIYQTNLLQSIRNKYTQFSKISQTTFKMTPQYCTTYRFPSPCVRSSETDNISDPRYSQKRVHPLGCNLSTFCLQTKF